MAAPQPVPLIRLLNPDDLSAAMRLKDAAGWNQTERDWANLLKLEPEGCFGIDCGGRLAATTTAVCYGRELAWIGMVLTDPEFRGRGFARALMEHALAWLERRGVGCVKLDATDMGRPLYEKLGFVAEGAVERWGREPSPAGQALVIPPPGFSAGLDREAFGADRSAALAAARTESMCIEGVAYSMARPGSKAVYFGPCVSTAAKPASVLLKIFVALHQNESIYLDLLPSNRNAVKLAEECRFRRLRSLVRMVRPAGAQVDNNDQYVYAIAGFEFG